MKLTVSKTKIKKQGEIELTTGMVGATLDLEFSDDWSGLTKKACFRCENVSVIVANPGQRVTIPQEILTQEGKFAEVGFYGYKIVGNEKVTVIPTIFADIAVVKEGADDAGAPPAPAPTPSELEQLQAIAADHEDRIEALEQGGGTTDHRQLTNRDAANQHPMSAISGLEDALDGKQPSGDYATTQELDGLANIVDGKGTYSKPSGGIPKSDLASAVQTSLGRADTALQSHQSLAGYATEQWVEGKTDSNRRKIENLEAIAEGLLFREEAVEGTDYIKTITDDVAPWATIDSIGGHSEVVEGEIVSAVVDKIASRNADDEVIYTYEIPDAVKALDGYGWSAGDVYNEVDFENKKFIKRVDRVDLGSLNWTYSPTYDFMASDAAISTPYDEVPFLCGIYSYGGKNQSNSSMASKPDKTVYKRTQDVATDIATRIYIKDVDYDDAAAFTTAMSGVMLYYELAEPIETDISEYLTEENVIDVEPNGTVTFEQDNGTQLEVPNSMTFVVDLGNYLAVEIEGKVDKVAGKGLSTNDYTNEDKAKVASAVQPSDLEDYALKTDLQDLQSKTITDSAGYFTTDTVEGALAEIGAELAGINTLIGSGVIT